MPHDSPLHVVHSHGSAESSMQQHDLTVLVNKLNDRIDGLEKDLQKISQIDEDPIISLVQDEEETPTEIIEEHGSGEKGKMEISTASPPKVTKKVKKRTQVQLSMDEELPTKMEEEERARFNAEQEARALQEEEEKRNKLVLIAQARRNMITYLKNQGGSEVEKGSSKPSKRETSKTVEEEKVEKEDVKPDLVMSEKKVVGTRRKTLARRRASDKQVEDSSKRQKKEKESNDFKQEKEDLRMWLSVLNDEEEYVTPEFLSVRYPIVNWEYQLLGRMEITNMEVYKLTRADGTVSFHGGTKSLCRRLDRDDLKVLYKLVHERFEDHSLEEKKLIPWRELKMMFDPDEQDEIWKNQESWKVLRWRLYENSGVHSVFLIDTPMEINMLVEKKYPLKKEILEKMINLKLQAEEESTMAFELIKFTRSQIEEKQAYVAMLRAAAPSTYILAPRSEAPPSGTPPLLPIPLPTPSPPLLPPSTDCRADVCKACLPPRKRLCFAFGLGYEVGKSSSTPTARLNGDFRRDYGFIATLDDEIMRDPKRDVGNGITDTWDEMLVGMLGAPATDETELGRRVTDLVTIVRQDIDEIDM
ncbi:hypothetical protein Tco_1153475 [Tanacetum coccineum]